MKLTEKRKIEVFSAGCDICQDTIAMVKRIACESCEVTILDMHQPEAAARAKELGIRSIPAIAINGKLADCCSTTGPQEAVLRAAGLGMVQISA